MLMEIELGYVNVKAEVVRKRGTEGMAFSDWPILVSKPGKEFF